MAEVVEKPVPPDGVVHVNTPAAVTAETKSPALQVLTVMRVKSIPLTAVTTLAVPAPLMSPVRVVDPVPPCWTISVVALANCTVEKMVRNIASGRRNFFMY